VKFLRAVILAAVATMAYVLGAKAGRGRYRDIRSTTKKAWNKPVSKNVGNKPKSLPTTR